jgi:hypothetical protein
MATKQSAPSRARPPTTKHPRTWVRVCERLGIRRPFFQRVDSYLPHSYLTDGVTLYRFEGWVDRSPDARFAELEDCRSLDIVLVSAEELARSVLRPVAIAVARSLPAVDPGPSRIVLPRSENRALPDGESRSEWESCGVDSIDPRTSG